MDDKRALRKKDVITGILLALVGAGMFYIATTYPMTEDYGGVRNVWFVSPALFPMIIAVLLVAFSLLLMANGIRYLVLSAPSEVVEESDAGRLYSFLFIILTLIVFVYCYIPAVDFYVATLAYLYLFIVNFFVPGALSLIASGSAYIAAGTLFLVLGQVSAPEDMRAQFWRDGLCTLLFLSMVWYSFRRVGADGGARRSLRIVLTTTLVFVTFMVTAFKFGVLIPMPREGFYCYYMDEVFFTAKDYFSAAN